MRCPKCDRSASKRGFTKNSNGFVQRYQCNVCGNNFQDIKDITDTVYRLRERRYTKDNTHCGSVRVNTQQWEILKNIGNGNASEGMRKLIDSRIAIANVQKAIDKLSAGNIFGIEMLERAIAEIKGISFPS